jgi:predicted DNA-binding transcriptional regulator AlpA
MKRNKGGVPPNPKVVDDGDQLLHPDKVAEMLGVSMGCLARYRREGSGPAFVKFGGIHKPVVRYRREDVRKWINERVQKVSK